MKTDTQLHFLFGLHTTRHILISSSKSANKASSERYITYYMIHTKISRQYTGNSNLFWFALYSSIIIRWHCWIRWGSLDVDIIPHSGLLTLCSTSGYEFLSVQNVTLDSSLYEHKGSPVYISKGMLLLQSTRNFSASFSASLQRFFCGVSGFQKLAGDTHKECQACRKLVSIIHRLASVMIPYSTMQCKMQHKK